MTLVGNRSLPLGNLHCGQIFVTMKSSLDLVLPYQEFIFKVGNYRGGKMADQPTVEDKKPVTAANEVEPATMPTPPAQASAPVTPSTAVTAPESPILVTESEVLPNQLNSQGLAEEVESLSG